MPLSELPPAPDEDRGELDPLIKKRLPGPRSRALASRLAEVESPAPGARRRARAAASGDAPDDDSTVPIVLTTGRGSNLYDVDGNRFVDLAAGFGSLLLGHGATATTRAMAAQTDRMVQGLGDVMPTDAKLALLERLARLHPGEKPQVILGTSGGDAVTAAIKTAVLATGRSALVAFEGAYHGLGYGPLSACGLQASYREPFAAQLGDHVRFAPYPTDAAGLDASLGAVEKALASGDVAAVLVEPILGRGGCVVPPDDFMRSLVELAHRHGALVIADEIWTGLGRCGAMVRSVAVGAEPDILCFGKGLGGGAPISACVAPAAIMEAWGRAEEVVHTSTHAGAPLACAMAIGTLDALKFRKLPERALEVGSAMRDKLRRRLEGVAGVEGVRGEGLMIGIALTDSALTAAVLSAWLRKGYIALSGGYASDGASVRDVITLTPSLTIAQEQLDGAVESLRDSLAEVGS